MVRLMVYAMETGAARELLSFCNNSLDAQVIICHTLYMISQSVLRAKIAHDVGKYVNPSEAAHAYGMTRQYLSLILGGAKISNAVAEKFGYRQVERQYVKIESKEEKPCT